VCTEICEGFNDLDADGILCNNENELSLGAYTEGTYPIKCQAAFKKNNSIGEYSALISSIVI